MAKLTFIYSYWQQLPWKDINKHILILQKRIYNASLECNLKVLKYNQNRLINSRELKLKAIESIFRFVSKYYLKYSNDKYSTEDTYKNKIIFSLLDDKKPSFDWILDKIKQYIISTSIQPEWKAKLEPCMLSKQSKFDNNIDFSGLFNKAKNKPFSLQINTLNTLYAMQHIDINYLLSKMELRWEIKPELKHWLQTQSIVQSFYPKNFFECRLSNIDYTFNTYLFYILCNGIEWLSVTKQYFLINEYKKIDVYKMFVNELNKYSVINQIKKNIAFKEFTFFFTAIGLKLNYIKSEVKYSNSITDSKKELLRWFLKSIKLFLYNKDSLGRLRANTKYNIYQSIYIIKNYFVHFHQDYYSYLTKCDVNYLRKSVKILLVSWLKKKYPKYRFSYILFK